MKKLLLTLTLAMLSSSLTLSIVPVVNSALGAASNVTRSTLNTAGAVTDATLTGAGNVTGAALSPVTGRYNNHGTDYDNREDTMYRDYSNPDTMMGMNEDYSY